MKVTLNKRQVEIYPSEVQALVNGAIRSHNGLKDAEYPLLDVLDALLNRLKSDTEFQRSYNETAQGD